MLFYIQLNYCNLQCKPPMVYIVGWNEVCTPSNVSNITLIYSLK